jgi:drug/metabolite transporter (DMT)-like permease
MRFVRGTPWPTRRPWRNATVVGALMLSGGMGGTAVAEQTVASGLVVACIAVVPLIIVLFSLAWGVRPGRLELLGIAVGLAGVLMLTRGHGFGASPSGLVAITIACVAWLAGSALSQRATPLAPGAMGVTLGGEVVSAFEWSAAGVVLVGVVLLLIASARRA